MRRQGRSRGSPRGHAIELLPRNPPTSTSTEPPTPRRERRHLKRPPDKSGRGRTGRGSTIVEQALGLVTSDNVDAVRHCIDRSRNRRSGRAAASGSQRAGR